MTLIAAIRSYEGVVICADTQETRAEYRITLDKIKPEPAGHYEVVIGGAGNVGSLVDGFIDTLLLAIKRWPAGLDEEGVYREIDAVLSSYHARNVAYDPALRKHKRLDFIYCIRDKTHARIFLLKSEGTGLSWVRKYAVVGFDAEIYEHKLSVISDPNAVGNHALFLAVHLLAFGESVLSVVRGERVIRVAPTGMKVESPEDVRELKDRLAESEKLVGDLLLKCPDTSIHSIEFKGYLDNIFEWVMERREYYMTRPVSMLSPLPKTAAQGQAEWDEWVRRRGSEKSEGQE